MVKKFQNGSKEQENLTNDHSVLYRLYTCALKG